ncbi:MAG: hypothetical protein JWN37_601 [Candidatus Nomurabacteria bacterium]|nr:hypothetical protein [Candidatus Nomurabacteria bacterium]
MEFRRLMSRSPEGSGMFNSPKAIPTENLSHYKPPKEWPEHYRSFQQAAEERRKEMSPVTQGLINLIDQCVFREAIAVPVTIEAANDRHYGPSEGMRAANDSNSIEAANDRHYGAPGKKAAKDGNPKSGDDEINKKWKIAA